MVRRTKGLVTCESIIPNLATLRQHGLMLREFWAGGLSGERDQLYRPLMSRANTFDGILAPEAFNHEATFEQCGSVFRGRNVGKEPDFDPMTRLDLKTRLLALLQVKDRTSLVRGVKAHVPFLDHPIVEFAATVPASIVSCNGRIERLLKVVFASRLPVDKREGKGKLGFPVPLDLWLKGGGPAPNCIGDTLGSRRACSRPYLGSGLATDTVLASRTYGRNLWALLSLESWHQKFVD